MTAPVVPPEAPTARPLAEQAPPSAATPPGALTPTDALARGSGARQLPAVVRVDATPRAQHFEAPDPVVRGAPATTLVTHEAPGARVQVFASDVAPRPDRLSIFDPRYRARGAALEAPPSPDELVELVAADIPVERLAAMRAREGRSMLDAAPREHALYTGPTVPVIVRDPAPTRSWATPAASTARLPARDRGSVLDAVPAEVEQRPTPCLYERERP